MPPLITYEEALELSRMEDRGEIEALIERAWKARLDNFGDSTDMWKKQIPPRADQAPTRELPVLVHVEGNEEAA